MSTVKTYLTLVFVDPKWTEDGWLLEITNTC